ncbi:DUF1206 domain-containing protein [Aeoliella sp. ICT_H6.2]|uniref:DUF1206 domain-containing protein n=1 Tax=Aeoliella straminimaris TaxID=2954799 RepID=A0A9X2FFF3_9BACT|nr:DUF1206 domain-containing protein [Aeoliella straminimaris]MCO6048030.1 DUF1206 domain-containing protein [Aeoliella straminimaris]
MSANSPGNVRQEAVHRIQSATASVDAGSSSAFEICGRLGYATKGLVYLVVGGLAAAAAWGASGQTTGSEGAIQTLGQQPFGYILLWVVAIGLAAYSIWRLVEAFYNGENYSSHTSTLKRVGYVVSAVIYGALAWKAAPFSASSPQSGSGGDSKQSAAAWVMSLTGGEWIVAAVGATIIGYGLYLIYKGATDKFTDKYNSAQMSETEQKVARYSGRIGLPARGVTFGVIGVFVIIAAMSLDPNKIKGTGEALDVLASQPYGMWVLLAVALGLACYGIFCFVQARYRSFAT